jgi:hypothetical protein
MEAANLGPTFVDPSSWIRDSDFSRDGLHLKRDGAKQLETSIAGFAEQAAKTRWG